jgi:hypothetical protein
MGLLDGVFGKKDNDKNEPSATQNNIVVNEALYNSLKKYNTYIVHYINMMHSGSFVPVAAYEKADGTLAGHGYMVGEDLYGVSAEVALQDMEVYLSDKLNKAEIKSYMQFYHSSFNNDDNHTLAQAPEAYRAISMQYVFADGTNGRIGMPYQKTEQGGFQYQGIAVYSQEHNAEIFETKLQENFNYFDDVKVLEQQDNLNANQVNIKLGNAGDYFHSWAGIFGGEYINTQEGNAKVSQYYELTFKQDVTGAAPNLKYTELDYNPVIFRALQSNEQPMGFYPIVKSSNSLPVDIKKIVEWDNVLKATATVSGNGRGEFGLIFLATDYAANKEKYQSGKASIGISAIGLAVEEFIKENRPQGENLPDGFIGYMPCQQIYGLGVFEFIGEVLAVDTAELLEDDSIQGHYAHIKLINHDKQEDFFTLSVFINKVNWRNGSLAVGKRITGLLQMQGQIIN